ncbi:MAG: cation diffusion facilitator family transporter [Acutalibacteraceae bacterium]
MKREKSVLKVCAFGAGVNLILFFIKLYVSLTSNSISIFSDSINNLSDCLSCVLSAVCMAAALKLAEKGTAYLVSKIEQVLSFILAIVVFAVGCGFAYSSIERFMYPTPVWFAVRYFIVVAVTAVIKLLMFFYYRKKARQTDSPVIRVMAADSLLDTGITVVTLITFTMTNFTKYTVDAAAGLFISIFIIIQAVRLIKGSLFGVLNFVPEEKRLAVESTAEEISGHKVHEISYSVDSEKEISAYITLDGENEINRELAEKIANACLEKTGIKAHIVF